MSDSSFSLTTFSPTGKLVQIEYALAAVSAGKTSLGIKGAFAQMRSHALSEESVRALATQPSIALQVVSCQKK